MGKQGRRKRWDEGKEGEEGTKRRRKGKRTQWEKVCCSRQWKKVGGKGKKEVISEGKS